MKDDAFVLLAVVAHPDDEAFGVSGTLSKYAAAGVRTALICATRGEAGLSAGLADTPAALAELRAEELRKSARRMGLHELYVLDFPDGKALEWDMERLTRQIATLIASVCPDVVITFDEHGITRHPDHIAVHHAVVAALDSDADRLGVRRLFFHIVTCEEEASPEGPDYACVSPSSVDVSVDIRKEEPVKRDCLAAHRTQAADTQSMLGQPPGSLTHEHYVLAFATDGWKPEHAEDLFEGMHTS